MHRRTIMVKKEILMLLLFPISSFAVQKKQQFFLVH